MERVTSRGRGPSKSRRSTHFRLESSCCLADAGVCTASCATACAQQTIQARQRAILALTHVDGHDGCGSERRRAGQLSGTRNRGFEVGLSRKSDFPWKSRIAKGRLAGQGDGGRNSSISTYASNVPPRWALPNIRDGAAERRLGNRLVRSVRRRKPGSTGERTELLFVISELVVRTVAHHEFTVAAETQSLIDSNRGLIAGFDVQRNQINNLEQLSNQLRRAA